MNLLRRSAIVLIVVGTAASALALTTPAARDRFGFAYLWGFAFIWTVVLASLFFVALQHATASVWSVVLRRVAEMLAAPITLVAILFVPIVIIAFNGEDIPLFPWLTDTNLPPAKRTYLSFAFFVARAGVFFVLWIAFARYFVRNSLRQDGQPHDEGITLTMRKVAGPFLVVFALTATFAAFDWLMSLDPYWASTIFGVYVFAGMVVAALAAITVATIYLRATGRLDDRIVTDEHLYNLGALLFAFVCFWAYIAFSQFMLIWYGNFPEETAWFIRRLDGRFRQLSVVLALLRFVIPFLLLLSRAAKMNPTRLVLVSVVLLVGHLVDLYWLIMPEHPNPHPGFGWLELGPLVLMLGILIASLSRLFNRHRLLAAADPLFEKSRQFRL